MAETDPLIQELLSREALPNGAQLLDGQFTITKQMSAGGFGITYRARDNVLERDVVIKECFSDDYCVRRGRDVIARTEQFDKQFRSIATMFMREARSLAQLRHPNIVGVHRAFEENETAYMALDLIEGNDLFDILEASPDLLPPDLVRDMLMRMLDAIEKVHEIDLLHRDISPDNILLEHDGNPVLIDFGAARADASRRTRAVSSLLVVKEGYSPKEFYVAGSLQEPCSDLYALGATFYHLVSGEAPVDSQTRMAAVARHKPDPCQPLAGRFPNYDDDFLDAIDQAMELMMTDRLQSAEDWRNMINRSGSRRAKGDAAPTQDDVAAPEHITIRKPPEGIPRELTQLIEETNEVVRKTRIIDVEDAGNAQTAAAAKPAERSSSVPDWVDEFNEETAAADSDGPGAAVGSTFDAASGNEKSTQDWIERARQKQTRVLEAELADLDIVEPYPEDYDDGQLPPLDHDQVAAAVDPTLSVHDRPAPPPPSTMMTLLKYLGSGIAIGLCLIFLQIQFLT